MKSHCARTRSCEGVSPCEGVCVIGCECVRVAPKVPSCLLSANFYIVNVFMRVCMCVCLQIRSLSALLVVLLHAAIYD